MTTKPLYMSMNECVDHIVETFGNDIRIGMPLGLGKPVPLMNALYRRAKENSDIKLTIYTALSLEKPLLKSDLEKRLMGPYFERTFKGVPDLDYMLDLRAEGLPENVHLHEVYTRAGAYTGDPKMQQDYMSSNYTHTVRDCSDRGSRIYTQMLAKDKNGDGRTYSTSCNADIAQETLERFKQLRKPDQPYLTIGVVNDFLPYMYGDAEVLPEDYDIIIDDPALYHPLFTVPRQPVSPQDFMLGMNVSTLIKDGGTLQIGIGALGDAVAYGLHLRNNDNASYNQAVQAFGLQERYGDLIDRIGGTGVFEKGLYGSTEMLVDGFLQLYKSGVMKRKVFHHDGIQKLINEDKLETKIPDNILSLMLADETISPYLLKKEFLVLRKYGVFKETCTYADGWISNGTERYSALLADKENLEAISRNCLGSELKNGVILTGGFFIGPQDFYDDLNQMPEEERRLFEMTGVDVANQLYGNETLRRLQRKDGRFCNTGMKASVLGAICSDGLDDGTVISGVGGQYNFVSMAHALEDGRCIMMIKSTRSQGAGVLSNIVYQYGHTTIPRHLKDIIVTEYGIADIRGRCDRDVIAEILKITDSRFQEELLAEAKMHGKIPADYEIPEAYRENTPEKLAQQLSGFKALGLFPDFPFGTTLTGEELFLAYALKVLNAKAAKEKDKIPEMMIELPDEIPENILGLFQRMGLDHPESKQEQTSFKYLMLAMRLAGFC